MIRAAHVEVRRIRSEHDPTSRFLAQAQVFARQGVGIITPRRKTLVRACCAKNPKNPLEGCAQLESPSRLIHNRQNLSRIPSWELRAVRIGSPAVNSFLTITSGETPVTPQDPFAADFLWAEKKTQTGYSRPAGPP